MNGVAMAGHGPILNDNEAMGARKVFRYLRGFWDTIKKSKMPAKVPKSPNTSTWYQVLSTWYLVPSTKYLVLGSKYLVLGSEYLVLGTW